MNTLIKCMSDDFFKNPVNFEVFKAALARECNRAPSRRELPNHFTKIMLEVCRDNKMDYIHIPHWHVLTDNEGKGVATLMASPNKKPDNYDLLRYLSMCLQFVDKQYARCVDEWCHRQDFCLDDPLID